MPVPLHGQLTLTTSAQPLSTTPVTNATSYTIKAAASNAGVVFVGASIVTTGNGFMLGPGDTLDYEPAARNGQNAFALNVSDFYAVGTAGDKLSWLASPATS